MTESEREREPVPSFGRPANFEGFWPLVLVVAVVGVAWAPLFGLFFTGEDFALLGRVRQGASASPHVFRPLLSVWLRVLHDMFGVEHATPFHAASLLLHAANTALVFLLGRRLFGSVAVAGVAAALFGLGGGALDALAWIAAVNRPLSTFGALLALNGLARFGRRPWAPAFVVAGLAWQFGSNEEFYGTALLAGVWLGGLAWREPRLRRGAAACAVLAFAALLLHRYGLGRVPDGFSATEGLRQLPGSVARRAGTIAAGFGLPSSLGVVLPLLGGVAIVACGRVRAGLFLVLTWGASLVPFALSDPVAYRFYPTQVGTALLVAGGVGLLVGRFVSRAAEGSRGVAYAGLFVGLVLAVVGSHASRTHGFERWRSVLHEIRQCAGPIRELAERSPDTPPVCVNLDASTIALAYYYWDFEQHTDVTWTSFLDAASAYVPVTDPPPEPWFGRRCEGSYGIVEPGRYFAGRPAIEGVRLYVEVTPVQGLDEARARLTQLETDLTRTAVVEAEPAELAALAGAAGSTTALEILEPFTNGPAFTASMRVRVTSDAGALLAYQEGWLYDPTFHFAPDWALLSGLTLLRPIRVRAVTGTGDALPTFHVNAYGLGALVPPGTHEVRLDFYRLSPAEWLGG